MAEKSIMYWLEFTTVALVHLLAVLGLFSFHREPRCCAK